MKRPTWDEIKLLFQSNKEEKESFIKKHQLELKDLLEDLQGEDVFPYFDTAFSWIYGVIVDWREYEEDLVTYFSETLDDEDKLSAIYDDKNNSEVITYNDEIHIVPLTESQADRYTVIRVLHGILREKYNFKLFSSSYMSDTHEFLLLPSEWWKEVERNYPDKVKEFFMDITNELDFP